MPDNAFESFEIHSLKRKILELDIDQLHVISEILNLRRRNL
jgi:hypothetical protein